MEGGAALRARVLPAALFVAFVDADYRRHARGTARAARGSWVRAQGLAVPCVGDAQRERRKLPRGEGCARRRALSQRVPHRPAQETRALLYRGGRLQGPNLPLLGPQTALALQPPLARLLRKAPLLMSLHHGRHRRLPSRAGPFWQRASLPPLQRNHVRHHPLGQIPDPACGSLRPGGPERSPRRGDGDPPLRPRDLRRELSDDGARRDGTGRADGGRGRGVREGGRVCR
mmetsp:Transcript_22281/g.55129  ORF Transcript_22281/g.55129 Transcript_22281/m.55129 type:complete len:230 (-) Transcript_22281:353-1042(-)